MKLIGWMMAVAGLLLHADAPAAVLPDGPVKTASAASMPGLELRTATTHPIRYYFAPPRDYERQPNKKWPVLLVLTGKGSDFEAMLGAHAQASAGLPFLLVAPCTFANNPFYMDKPTLERYREFYAEGSFPKVGARIGWDEAGILAILKDLQARDDAEEQCYITAFSGGSYVAYQLLLTRPQVVAAVATVCGNFLEQPGHREEAARHSPEARAVPVLILQGEDDVLRHRPTITRKRQLVYFLAGAGLAVGLALLLRYRWKSRRGAWAVALGGTLLAAGIVALWPVEDWGLDVQTHAAEALLRELGYTDVQRRLVPGREHEPLPGEVIEAFRPIWQQRQSTAALPP